MTGSKKKTMRAVPTIIKAMGTRSVEAELAADFFGAPIYWSGFDSETNKRLIEESGLHVISAREETDLEFDEPGTFLWVVAQKRE
jgi:hypothetical protein